MGISYNFIRYLLFKRTFSGRSFPSPLQSDPTIYYLWRHA